MALPPGKPPKPTGRPGRASTGGTPAGARPVSPLAAGRKSTVPAPPRKPGAGAAAPSPPPSTPSPLRRPGTPIHTPVTPGPAPVRRPSPIISPVPGVKKSTTPSSRAPGYDPSKDRLLGTVLGKCKLIKHIGKGGMGDVYLGEHTLLQKKVAVKVLPSDFTRNEELISRFRREAVAAARLEHPNIVQVHDIGSDRDTHYIIMQFVEGKSLQDRLDELNGPFEVKEAARVLADTARGLGAAHKAGIVHRDVKPANVLLSDKGEVKITDFGLAHDQESQSLITMPGAMMGTPHFMSPEQAEGKVADNRSDIYALGVVLYYLVTGKRPFLGETHMAVLYKHINEEPTPPKRLNPQVTDALARVISKCMAKRPELRYATCEDLARDLDAVVKGGPAPARGSTVPVPTGRLSHHGATAARKSTVDVPAPALPRRRKNQLVLILSLGSILALVGVLALVILMNRGSGKLAESPSPSASPSASPSGLKADSRHDDLLAKAKDAFLLGDKDEDALKLVEDALKVRESKEARELAAKIFGRIRERKAEAALSELEKSPAAKEPDDLVAALDQFLKDHAGTKAAERATSLRAKAIEEADAAAAFKPEEGFDLVRPEAFQRIGSDDRTRMEVRRDVLVLAQGAASDKLASLAIAPGTFADCIFRFEAKVTQADLAGPAFRYHSESGRFMRIKLPWSETWIPVEVTVTGFTVQYSVDRGAPLRDPMDGAAAEGGIGLYAFPGGEIRARRFRVKRLRSKPPTSPSPSPSPGPTADPAEKAAKELKFLNVVLGEEARQLAAQRRYEELAGRVNRDDVESPEAKAALAALKVRVEAADRVMKAFTAALREFPGGEALSFKLRGGPEQRGYVRGLAAEGVTLAVGSGVMTVPLKDFDPRTVVEVAGRRSKEATTPLLALFALAEKEVKLASDQIFTGKRLKTEPAAAEPILEALLAPPDLELLAIPPKDAQPLMDLFLAAKDQFKSSRSGALLERMAQAARDAALEDDITAIVKLTGDGKHKDAKRRFLDFAKTNPAHPGMRRLAMGVYPSLMSLGWEAGFKSEGDLRAGSSASQMKVSGDEIFASARGEDGVTVHVTGLSGDGLAGEFQTGTDGAMAGLLLDFKGSADWVQFVVQGGRAKLWVRRDSQKISNKIELGEVAVPGTDVWTELAAMRIGDQVWFFVGGKLVHRGEKELLNLDGEAGINFFYEPGKARRFRKHNPE